MPGSRITRKQEEMYMKNRQTGLSQEVAAARSGVSVRSGRRIERGERNHVPRTWRTREDPLGEVWENALGAVVGAGAGPDRADIIGVPGRHLSGRLRRAHPAHPATSGAALEGGAWAGIKR